MLKIRAMKADVRKAEARRRELEIDERRLIDGWDTMSAKLREMTLDKIEGDWKDLVEEMKDRRDERRDDTLEGANCDEKRHEIDGRIAIHVPESVLQGNHENVVRSMKDAFPDAVIAYLLTKKLRCTLVKTGQLVRGDEHCHRRTYENTARKLLKEYEATYHLTLDE